MDFSCPSLTAPDLLEEHRTRLRAKLGQVILSGKRDCKCEWGEEGWDDRYHQFMLGLYGPLTPKGRPSGRLLRIIEVMEEDYRDAYNQAEWWCKDRHHHRSNRKENRIRREAVKTIRRKTGLTIDFVRAPCTVCDGLCTRTAEHIMKVT